MEFLLIFKYLILYSLVVAVSISLLLWKKPNRFISIFIVITLLIPLSVWSYTSIDSIMGYAYNSYPPSNSIMISYIIKPSTEKIEVWMLQPNRISRLFSFPLTEKLKKKLKELQKGKRGNNIVFNREKELSYDHPNNWRLKNSVELLPSKD